MRRNEFIRTHAVDAEWFLALKAINTPLLLHSLQIPAPFLNDESRERFFQDTTSPQVTYAHIDADASNNAKRALLNLQTRIIQEERRKAIARIYSEKIEELVLDQDILLAAARGDTAVFDDLNRERFGVLDVNIVRDMRAKLQNRYTLFDYLGPCESSAKIQVAVTRETFARAKRALITLSFPSIDDKQVYVAAQIKSIFTDVLAENALGWRAELDATSIHMRVDNRHRTICIPVNMRARGHRLKRIVAHEIGVHLRRRINGRSSCLQLLGIGLPGHLAAEEGLGVMAEQILGDQFFDYGGHDKYLALSIATGIFDGQVKDFRDTCLLLQKYFYARQIRSCSENVARRVSKDRAWRMTWRVFRGGNPSIPGNCLLRDKLYREGNIRMWNFMAKTEISSELLFAGKYDPSREDHRALVATYS